MPADKTKLERVARDLYGADAEVDHLGTGGFASTFKIQLNGETFAAKMLDPEIADLSRFDKELAALQRIDSPNVVQFRGHGRHVFDGVEYGYIEMELAAGYSLAQLVDGGQVFSMAEAANVLREIVNGAVAIWEAGTAHRDLSPKNILLHGEHAVIVDLGLANHVDDATQTTLPTPGTPGWMSPEQVDMSSPSHGDWRSDQFVIGLLGYYLLTGQRPYRDGSQMERWAAPAQRDAPNVRVDFPDVSPALAAVITKMTARQPARRYVKSSALVLDLERAIAALGAESETENTPTLAFYPVFKYYNGFAKKDFLPSLRASTVILGGQAQKAVKEIFEGAREGGGRVAIDPDTFLARSPKSFKPDGYKKLGYGSLDLTAPFASDSARRTWCDLVWQAHKPSGPDIMISPYFYAGPSELQWVRESLNSGRAFSEIVAEDRDAHVEVWNALAINQSWLRLESDRDSLLNELTATPFSTLYLMVATTQSSFAPLADLATIRGFADLISVMREAEVRVVVGQRGPSGLLLLALGASGWSAGISANLLNAMAHPETKDIKRRGQPRIYVPQLLNFVPATTYELMRDREPELVALHTHEGIALLAAIDDFSKLTSAQTVLLYRHNIRAVKDHTDELAAALNPATQLRDWIDAATNAYRTLQNGNVPAFLPAWTQALTG